VVEEYGMHTRPAVEPDARIPARVSHVHLLLCLLGISPAPASAQSGNPEWSPDGALIAFETTRDGNPEIYVMNADGSETTNLSSHPATEMHPSWTPDGRSIVFDSDRSGDSEIYVMGRDGSDVRRLTHSPEADLVGRVSPDGRRIAFNTMRDGQWEVYVMNLDGSGATNVSKSASTDIVRSWSRDGRIQFDSDRAPNLDGRRDAYSMAADGSDVRRLTIDPWDNRFLRRGPPGTDSIAFTSDRSGTRGIYLMDASGAGVRTLYDGPGQDSFPSWAPDGAHIVFQSDESGSSQLHVMRSDGSAMRLLTGTQNRPPKPHLQRY
jgi:Tol biopolymer transport system component